MMQPEQQGKWMAEVERRLRVLEQTPRVPSVSMPGSSRGIRMARGTGGDTTGEQLTTFSNDTQIVVESSPAGQLLMFVGATLRPGNDGGVAGITGIPRIDDGRDMFIQAFDAGISADDDSLFLRRDCMTVATVSVMPSAMVTITMEWYAFGPGGSTVRQVFSPWMVVIPL